MADRVDWPSISKLIEASGYLPEEPFLFVLPHAGRHLLLAIAERLEWRATYNDKQHGYDFADWDELQALVAATHAGLMEMEQVNLIVAKLEEIREELELIRQAQQQIANAAQNEENLEDDLQDIAQYASLIATILGA
jgi:hypothetical protein